MVAVVKWLLHEATENEEEGLMNASLGVHGAQEARECWHCYDKKNADINHLLAAHWEDRRAERTAPDGDPKRETAGPRNRNTIDWPLDPIVSAPLPVTPYMNSPLSLPLSRHAAFASYLFLYRSTVPLSTLSFFSCRLLFINSISRDCVSKVFSSILLLLHQHTPLIAVCILERHQNQYNLSLQVTDSYHSLSLNVLSVDSLPFQSSTSKQQSW
jgi:hypothetical protein